VTGDVRDFIGIGLGPFNLGLACLTDPLDELDGLFLEARHELAWHPGMLLDDATLQVPFLADLVSMADPTSRFSFLNHLKETGNLYPFYIRESFYPLRREYDQYCRWAADRLRSVRFGRAVDRVEHDGTAYVVTDVTWERHRTRRLVLGTGTTPKVPDCVDHLLTDGGPALHSSDYLHRKDELLGLDSIAVVGSGQSAAEIYRDLLLESRDRGYALTWLTRSPRFFPMEYTKLTLEMTSPEYSAYFHDLPERTRDRLLREQRSLYKGISGDLVDEIFDLHYQLRVSGELPPVTLLTNTAVTDGRWDGAAHDLSLHHTETGEAFGLRAQGVVMATGYGARVPSFLDGVRDRIAWDAQDRYAVTPGYTIDHAGSEIYVQNAEEHTHGLVAPDLGMGAHRNSVIIASMLGREVYPVEKQIAVQSFGVPDHLREVPAT
jgi:lysine N6-hydroxylase